MVCTDLELWWWIREGRCALKQSLNRILDDERKGTSNVIFIVPSRSDLFCSTLFPNAAFVQVVVRANKPETPGLHGGVWSHQVGLGLGLAPGGSAQNSWPGGSGMSELLSNSSGLKVRVQL